MGKLVVWSYLWHLLSHFTSESGVQLGDPLGPLYFSLVLHKVIAAIDANDDCLRLILQALYLDDCGLLAPNMLFSVPSHN